MIDEHSLDQQYDGITLSDNPCPAWWRLVFHVSVVFSFGYFMYYQVGGNGQTLDESYSAALAQNARLRFKNFGDLKPDEPTLLKYMKEPEGLAIGKSVFTANCQSCHAANGSGLIGPNMTDDYYKNIEKITDIPRVIENGANNGSMPAWRGRLVPNEVVLVASYIASLRGKNLPGRPPEGKKIPPWPSVP